MQDNISFYKYYKVNSDIHALNPLSKIICLLILIVSLILIDNLNIISIIFVFELIICIVTNIPLTIIMKNILCMKYLIIFIFIINIFLGLDFYLTILLVLKIIGISIYSSIFILTTTTKEILNGLTKFLYPLNLIGINSSVIALIISLAIRFVTIILEEADRILISLKSRGLSVDSSLSSKFVGLKSLIIPLYLSSLKKADNLSDMMELRLYNINNKKKYNNMPWSILDSFFVIMHVIIIVIVLKEVML